MLTSCANDTCPRRVAARKKWQNTRGVKKTNETCLNLTAATYFTCGFRGSVFFSTRLPNAWCEQTEITERIDMCARQRGTGRRRESASGNNSVQAKLMRPIGALRFFFLFCSQCCLISCCSSLANCLFCLWPNIYLHLNEFAMWIANEAPLLAFALCGMFSMHKHLFLHYFSSKNVLLFWLFYFSILLSLAFNASVYFHCVRCAATTDYNIYFRYNFWLVQFHWVFGASAKPLEQGFILNNFHKKIKIHQKHPNHTEMEQKQ